MKKILGLIMGIILSLFVSGTAFGQAAALLEPTGKAKQISMNPGEKLRVYDFATLAAGASITYKIPMSYATGWITFARVVTATSIDFDAFLNGADNGTVDDYDLFLHAEDVNLSYTWPIIEPMRYFNTETVEGSYLFFTIENTDAANATGAGSLILAERDR